jgi:hypothetical protein
MGVLSKLFGKSEVVKMQDPDFGEMVFMEIAEHPERSYWEGEWHYPPTATQIGVFIPGDASGLRSEARAFILQKQHEWDKIVSAVLPVLSPKYTEWTERVLAPGILSDLDLAPISVKLPVVSPITWEISFETRENEEKWRFSNIGMKDWAVEYVAVDT